MTKEQIIDKHSAHYPDGSRQIGTYGCSQAMEEYMIQEVTAEREKAAKLVRLLEEIDKSFYMGPDIIEEEILQWYIDVMTVTKDEIKQSLTEYKKQ
jgi:hypothetical protein